MWSTLLPIELESDSSSPIVKSHFQPSVAAAQGGLPNFSIFSPYVSLLTKLSYYVVVQPKTAHFRTLRTIFFNFTQHEPIKASKPQM